MNKKANTIWFLLGATVFNLVVTVVSFLGLLALYGWLVVPMLPESAGASGVPVIFIASFVIAFFVYRVALKAFMKRVDMENKLDPLFGPRRRPPRS